MVGNLFGKIMGFLVIIITLALAPSINTAAVAVAAANLTNLIGMAVISNFASPLIILGLLVAGGAFAVAGIQGTYTATTKDLMGVVGATIVAIVALTFMTSIVSYTNTLWTASAGSTIGQTIFSIIPLVVYLGIIGGTGWSLASSYKKGTSS